MSYIVYSAYKQHMEQVPSHIHKPLISVSWPIWKALEQTLQSLRPLLREELLQHLLRGTPLVSCECNSNRLTQDHFVKAVNQKGDGRGAAARIRRSNSRE